MKPIKIPWSKAPPGTTHHLFESRGYGFWRVETKYRGGVIKEKLVQSGLMLPPEVDYRSSTREIPVRHRKENRCDEKIYPYIRTKRK